MECRRKFLRFSPESRGRLSRLQDTVFFAATMEERESKSALICVVIISLLECSQAFSVLQYPDLIFVPFWCRLYVSGLQVLAHGSRVKR